MFPHGSLPDKHKAPLRELSELVWGAEAEALERYPFLRLQWTPRSDWMILGWENGVLVTFVAMVQRTVLIDGTEMRAGGLASVITHPDHRRRGFARAAVQRAMDYFWNNQHLEVGVLISAHEAIPLYEGLGWQPIVGSMFCEQPEGRFNFTEAYPTEPAMVAFPPGAPQRRVMDVDLQGLPW